MSDLKVTIYFDWQQASADPRQYGQQRTLLTTSTRVAIDVPLKHEYIWNAEAIIKAQLAGDNTIEPVLTPLGVVYVDEVFAAAYFTLEKHEDEDKELPDEDIQWQPSFDEEKKIAYTAIEDNNEFPVEELIDDEDELDEILWEN